MEIVPGEGWAEVKYFKVTSKNRFDYFAAASENAVLENIGKPDDPSSLACKGGYNLDTLEEIDRFTANMFADEWELFEVIDLDRMIEDLVPEDYFFRLGQHDLEM